MWRARIKKSFFPSPEGGENCVAEKRAPGFACQKGGNTSVDSTATKRIEKRRS